MMKIPIMIMNIGNGTGSPLMSMIRGIITSMISKVAVNLNANSMSKFTQGSMPKLSV